MAEENVKAAGPAGLEKQVHNLTKLIDINGIINSTLDIGKLLTIIMEIIKEIMNAEASTLLLYDVETTELVFKVALGEAGMELTEKYRVRMGQGIAGWTAQNRKSVYVNNVYSDPRFDPDYDRQTGFTTKSIMCSPLLFKGKLIGVIQAINPINRPGFSDEDMRLFTIFSDQAALAVQNAIFFQNAIEEERIQIELDSARSIQDSILPEINTAYNGLQVSARSISAREVGGEFHGVYELDSRTIGIGLGDIHEKGMPGSLHASIVSGALRALAGVCGRHPAELIRLLKNSIVRSIESVDRVSLFYGTVDLDSRRLRYINAGVAYPILVRDGLARYLRVGKSTFSNADGSMRRVTVQLRPRDIFVILTDGILNTKNPNGKQLGLRNIMNFLEGDFSGPEDIVRSLVDYVDEYSGGVGRRQDISIISLQMV